MDRPQPLDPAPEFFPLPDALSHRQLTEWLKQAPRETEHAEDTAHLLQDSVANSGDNLDDNSDDNDRLQSLLRQHEALSQAILEELSRQGEAMQGRYRPPQLMALGALAAHLRLGLQALAASWG